MSDILLPRNIEATDRYNCFIVFEPASLRIHDQDIMCLGKDVQPFFDKLFQPLFKSQNGLREEMLFNRLSKFSQMLDLVTNKDQLVITKFFDRIWRRYGYVSHLGEVLFSLEDLIDYLPEYKKNPDILADRSLQTEEEAFEEEEN